MFYSIAKVHSYWVNLAFLRFEFSRKIHIGYNMNFIVINWNNCKRYIDSKTNNSKIAIYNIYQTKMIKLDGTKIWFKGTTSKICMLFCAHHIGRMDKFKVAGSLKNVLQKERYICPLSGQPLCDTLYMKWFKQSMEYLP